MSTPRIAGVVPCAGRSRRMGADKATLDAGGETFLQRAITTLAPACETIVVVVEADRTDLAEHARATGAEVVLNPDPTDGPISSIRAALAHLGDGWDGMLLLPVDHPAVAPETVRGVVDAFAREACEIVVPVHDGRTGHPPLFGHSVFAELIDPALEGGARTVVHRDPDRVLRLDLEDDGILRDLDTPDAWSDAVEDGALSPPAGLELAEAAAHIVTAVEAAREAVLVTRLEPLPPTRLLLVSSPDRSQLNSMGTLGDPALDAAVRERALPILAGRLEEGELEVEGVRLYAEAHRPQPELVIVGAGHISLPLAQVGDVLGFRVRVLDDRPAFARADRFADAVDVRKVDFADAFSGVPIGPLTHLVLVTRGHKYDYECLRQVLALPVQPRYIGLIGSRRRVRATFVQLLAEGLDRDRVASVRAPVGLDLGAETPGEIAVAVAAEIVREWRGGTGDPLREKERILDRFFREDQGEVR